MRSERFTAGLSLDLGPYTQEQSAIDDDEGYIPLACPSDDRNRSDHREERGSSARIVVFLSNAPAAAWRAVRRGRARLRRPSLAREIVREFYSCLCRIRTICGTKPYLYGLRFGPAADDLWNGRNHERIHACILGMRAIITSRPWATYSDRQLIVEGWLSGAKWGLGETHIPYADILRSDQLASANPDGGNSMPPSGVPQSTKRDSSNPLPSRE
jgi:hypothetical protein